MAAGATRLALFTRRLGIFESAFQIYQKNSLYEVF